MKHLATSHLISTVSRAMRAIVLAGMVFCVAGIGYATEIRVIPPTDTLPDVNARSPGDAIASIIAYGIGLTAVLALIAITWGAIVVISGAGDEEKMKQGRKIIIYALIGVFLSGIAYLVVNLVSNINLT